MLLGDARDDHTRSRFATIPLTMWTLLMDGTFMDSAGSLTRAMYEKEEPVTAAASLFIFMLFSMLSALTVLNMLIGVQCEVVSAVAAREKDEAEVGLMKRTVLVMLKSLDADGSGAIDQDEMNNLLEDPEALEILDMLSIDVKHLLNHLGMLYTVYDDISIADVMEAMLQFRGDRSVTMKDVIDLQTYSLWLMNVSPKLRDVHIARITGDDEGLTAFNEQ